MRMKVRVWDKVCAKYYPDLFKDYESGMKVIRGLFKLGYYTEGEFYVEENLLDYFNFRDVQRIKLVRAWDTLWFNTDLSVDESDFVLATLAKKRMYLGCGTYELDGKKGYVLLNIPALRLGKVNYKALFMKTIPILSVDPFNRYWDRGYYRPEMGEDDFYHYTSDEFISEATAFLKTMCRNNKFDMDFYEKHSDIIDFFILKKPEGYGINLGCNFALGYSSRGLFEFVAY